VSYKYGRELNDDLLVTLKPEDALQVYFSGQGEVLFRTMVNGQSLEIDFDDEVCRAGNRYSERGDLVVDYSDRLTRGEVENFYIDKDGNCFYSDHFVNMSPVLGPLSPRLKFEYLKRADMSDSMKKITGGYSTSCCVWEKVRLDELKRQAYGDETIDKAA
jgi:hypothetical protein